MNSKGCKWRLVARVKTHYTEQEPRPVVSPSPPKISSKKDFPTLGRRKRESVHLPKLDQKAAGQNQQVYTPFGNSFAYHIYVAPTIPLPQIAGNSVRVNTKS